LCNTLRLLLIACLLCTLPEVSRAYSVLTHEQLIDLTWKDLLEPLLKKRFPKTTAADLNEAHAYAYGGCAIQDLGYYPFSHALFSNLTHYVRSGDFVTNLLRDARNANELAFALGALSHYVGDTVGHHDAINRATAIAFPKLERKYGGTVAYDQNPHAHIRTEFAFDIDQLSKHRLAPGAYLRFIGLRVPNRLLAQAFEETYSLPLRDVVGPGRPAIRSYRTSVRSFLPRFAYAETVIHKNDFFPDGATDSFQTYIDRIERADFQTVWNHYRRKPGIKTNLLAFVIRILPRIGALSDLAIKIPTQETQNLYVTSVNHTIEVYADFLKQLTVAPQLTRPIANLNLDTGEDTRAEAYSLTDKTYATLLHKIVIFPQRRAGPDLIKNILDHYSDDHCSDESKPSGKTPEVAKDLIALRRHTP